MVEAVFGKKLKMPIASEVVLLVFVGIAIVVSVIMIVQNGGKEVGEDVILQEQTVVANEPREVEDIAENNVVEEDKEEKEEKTEKEIDAGSEQPKAEVENHKTNDVAPDAKTEELAPLGEEAEVPEDVKTDEDVSVETVEISEDASAADKVSEEKVSDEEDLAAQKIMAEEIAKEIAKNNATGRVVASGTNSYPYQNRCPQENWYFTGRFYYGYGGYICECTSYAGYKAYEYYGIQISSWGNAKYWGNSALAHGYSYDSTPEAHTVGFSTAGVYGHVVWIETVNSDGTVDLSEYNNSYSSVSGSIADFGYRSHVPASSYRYIHFR